MNVLERWNSLQFRSSARNLNSPDPGKRQKAARKIAGFRDLAAFELMLEAASDASPKVRCTAVRALGQYGAMDGHRNVEPLLKATHDPDHAVRWAAAEELGKTRDAAAVEWLISVARDDTSDIQAAAARSLGNTRDPKVLETLVCLLRTNDPVLKSAAQDAIQSLKSRQVGGPNLPSTGRS